MIAKPGIRLLERSVYRGPHLYSMMPMIRLQVDIGALEEWPTDRLSGFADRLLALLPGLARHGCSYSQPGGFVQRLRQGTWLGHVIEHVALELQSLAGHVATRGKTRSVRGRAGVYNILYAYVDEAVGLAAGAAAVRMVAALLPEELRDVQGLEVLGAALGTGNDEVVAALRVLARRGALGPTTQSLVDAARRRGIPVLRLNDLNLIQLGQGRQQQRIRAGVTGHTSLVAAELAHNKHAAKMLMAGAGLPIASGDVVRTADEAARLGRRLGWPVVIKPLRGNHGRGVTTGIASEAAARAAFAAATDHGPMVVVERQLAGDDHRVLVIGGRMVAAARRVPAMVIGDGHSTIRQLIEAVNSDPRRGAGHGNVLTRIVPDAALLAVLARERCTLLSVPRAREEVALRDTANLSTGGTAIDCTDTIHAENIAIAEQAAAVIGLDIAGIDLLSPDISRPLRETGGGIVEVNAAPGFRMHLHPSQGQARDVAEPVIRNLFPRGSRSRIPIFAITGTNGKSTTARMVSRILCEAGMKVGLATTSGVYVGNHLLVAGDCSGPKSARTILRNPTVEVAVLETARGGILREGLGFDRCDVGAVLNVTADHLGLSGIETVQDLARVKAVVAASVKRTGHCVLNADDSITVRMARRTCAQVVWFSSRRLNPALHRHVEAGGMSVLQEDGPAGFEVVLYKDRTRTVLMRVDEMPAAMGGAAQFNVQNAMAAAAMCIAQDIPLDAIRSGLRGFTTSFEDSPGRLNVHDGHGFRVIVDYAHNPAAIAALGKLIDTMRPAEGRVFGMVSIPGDRRDEDLIGMGRLAAGIFDEIMFREAPDGRGRPAGSINALMSQGAIEAGMRPECVHRLVNETQATAACLNAAQDGDLIALMPTDVEAIWQQVVDFQPARAVPAYRQAATGG